MFADKPTDVPAKVRVGARKLKGKYYIAEGGFSHVFAVKDTKSKEYFALKRMRCKDEKQLAHAIEEVAVMKRIPAHPFIVDLAGIEISHSEEGVSTVDILMKLMKGGRLIDVMKARSKHFAMEEMLAIFTCVLNGVSHLHALGVAHRDLKIENVLLDNESGPPVWKICDFGSCSTQTSTCTTEAEVAAAIADIELNTTPSYRAPEMVAVRIGTVTGSIKSDIWALGCMLYKMAYFKDAFPESNEAAICTANYSCPDEPPLPAAFQHMLGLTLQIDPNARPRIDVLVEHVEMLKSWQASNPSTQLNNIPNSLIPERAQPRIAPPTTTTAPPRIATAGLPPANVPDHRSSPTLPVAPVATAGGPTPLVISRPATPVAAEGNTEPLPELPALPAPMGGSPMRRASLPKEVLPEMPQPMGTELRERSSSSATLGTTHRRTGSLPDKAATQHKPHVTSKSADGGAAYTIGAKHESSKSDGAVLQQTQHMLMTREVDQIHEQLRAIEAQETELKAKRRMLGARLVQIYEQQPALADSADLVSRGLTAPVSSTETPQVEVACFFAGGHDTVAQGMNRTPKARHGRSNSLSSAEDLFTTDHGPRTPVSGDVGGSSKWPDVVLTLESFEEEPSTGKHEEAHSQGQRSSVLTRDTQQQPLSAQPAMHGSNAAARIQRSHRRSASMSVGGISIRPFHQQSAAQRKSPTTLEEEGAQRPTSKMFSLQPPPPPQRRK